MLKLNTDSSLEDFFVMLKNDPRGVYGYARTSTDEQKQNGKSILAQDNNIKEYCSVYGLSLNCVFSDDGVSSGTFKRKSFQELLKKISSNEVKILIVKNQSRLIRDIAMKRSLEAVFKKYKVKVILLEGDWVTDEDSIEKRTLCDFTTIIDENQRKRVWPDTLTGLIASAKEGNWAVGRVPRGYIRVANEKSRKKGTKIIPIESERWKYVLFFQMVASRNYTQEAIMNYFNSKQLFDFKFVKSVFYKITHDPAYKGSFVQNWYQEDHHTEPMISEELWQEVQDALNKRKRKTRHQYLFKGIIKCNCGEYCIAEPSWNSPRDKSPKRLYLYYKCPNCNKRISEKKVLEQSLSSISNCLFTQTRELLLMEYEERIIRIEKRLKILSENFDDDLISCDFYSSEIKASKKKIKNYQSEMDTIKNQITLKFDELGKSGKVKEIHKHIKTIVIDINKQVILKIEKNSLS